MQKYTTTKVEDKKNMNTKIIKTLVAFASLIAVGGGAEAGVPLNNLQGTGGIAFNPLAYTAGRPWEGNSTSNLNGIVSKPQVGTWFVNLGDAGINWWATSAAVAFADRLEVSTGYGFVDAHRYGDKSINTYNLGAKVRIVDENGFANVDILPAENIAIGVEYKQGVNAGSGIRNHDYWDGHVAWFVNKSLTLVAAYAVTGDKDRYYRYGNAKDLGVGDGLVFSAQYQF
jgi:hypothetical protein